ERGLPHATLESVVKCEHKYWSRLVQSEVIDEYPAFALLDLEDERPMLPEGLSYPVWIKPIKSASSEGARYVTDEAELASAAVLERTDVDRMGVPFNEILELLELPPEIARVGGRGCLVEEAITGVQATLEGYSHGDDIVIYGIVDSLTYPGVSSFLRYEYPSVRVPQHVQNAMGDVSRRVISAIGLRNSTFNIEFLWNPDSQQLMLLEVNARHSQSHAHLFALVDGISNHALMLDLALGRAPRDLPRRQGAYTVAARCFIRRFSDGVVKRSPTPVQVAALEAEFPDAIVVFTAAEGNRLADARGRDSYSYLLAEVILAAHTEEELERQYNHCVENLPFVIENVQKGA
ncbi:MAG: ATP-grasp domain-containing protein, partial [Leucobacter sp.]